MDHQLHSTSVRKMGGWPLSFSSGGCNILPQTPRQVQNKVLLLVDCHSSHKSYEAVKFASENGIILLCFHRIAHIAFNPWTLCFSDHWRLTRKLHSGWKIMYPGRAVNQFQINGLLNAAYGKAATAGIASSGFQKPESFLLIQTSFLTTCMHQLKSRIVRNTHVRLKSLTKLNHRARYIAYIVGITRRYKPIMFCVKIYLIVFHFFNGFLTAVSV